MGEATQAASVSQGRPSGRPWSQAWIDALPVAPVWAGVGFAVAHVLAGLAYHALWVAPDASATWDAFRPAFASTLIFALLIGYAPAALAYARRGQRNTLAQLEGALRCPDPEREAFARELERFEMPLLRTLGVVAALTAMGVTLFTTQLVDRLGPDNPALPWIVWQNALAFWLSVRSIGHDLRVSQRLARWTEQWAAVDLLDTGPLAPLAARGLQSALLIVLALSIFSLVLVIGNVSPVVPYTQALSVGLAAFALLLPSLGVHRRLRAQKREEAARLGTEIRTARTRPADEARLASLLTLRHHVESAREWPFDLGTLGRFALYAAIGLGSWLGGALVERVLDLALG